MSKPQNPLNEFRSYSYYFLMGVAGSTQAIQDAAESVGPTDERGEKGNWTLLINGAKDTRFIVKSVRFQSILTPNEFHKNESYFHTMNFGGEVTIQEPMGIRLYEELRLAAEKYQADAGGLNFFLKPIFVGYKPNSPPTVISNTKAFLFMGVDMTSAINEGGATYNMKAVGVVNGAGKTPAYQTIADGFSLRLNDGITLGEAIHVLEVKLNEVYGERKSMDESATSAEGIQVNYDEQKTINYTIFLDDHYNDYYVGTNIKDTYKEKAAKDGGKVYVVQPPKSDIESLIKTIMLSCEDIVIKDRAQPKGDYIVTKKFNIQQYVESTDSTIEVYYFIAPFDMEFVPTNYKGTPQPPKFLEFDYIYTGKNIDIRNFDLKMQMGSIWFNTPAIANTLDMAERQQQNNCVGINPITSKVNKDGSGGAKGLPEVHSNAGISDKDIANKKKTVSTSSYISQLKRWSELESIGVKLEIKGNPQLLEETTFTPKDVRAGKPATATGTTLYSDFGAFKGPVRIKVNVKFPENYENPRSNFVQFWYDGAYNVIDIDNVFEDGDFIQIITMYANSSDMYNDTGAQDAGCDKQTPVGGPTPVDDDKTVPPLPEESKLKTVTNLPELPGKLAAFLSESANNFDNVLDGTADILKSVTQNFTIVSDTIKNL